MRSSISEQEVSSWKSRDWISGTLFFQGVGRAGGGGGSSHRKNLQINSLAMLTIISWACVPILFSLHRLRRTPDLVPVILLA